jgi:hypothetical protein
MVVGQQSVLWAAATGGTLLLHFAYTGLPTGCSSSDTSTLSCTPSAPGAFRVAVTVTDGRGNRTYSNLSVAVESPPTIVVFNPVGLPSGHQWGVAFGYEVESAFTAPILFSSVVEGAASYYVSIPPGLSVQPSSGSLVVGLAPINVTVVFELPGWYLVTFNESGLPPGTPWSTEFAYIVIQGTSSSLLFEEPNGTYPYSVTSPSGYIATPAGGEIDVAGSAQTLLILYSVEPLYPVLLC